MSNLTAITIELDTDNGPHRMTFEGREAWALGQLRTAGEQGVTPIHRPAPRWSHYIHMLRKAGLDIETIHEPHGGPFSGHHGRYVLRSRVKMLHEVEA
jgi:hypothetical protein